MDRTQNEHREELLHLVKEDPKKSQKKILSVLKSNKTQLKKDERDIATHVILKKES